MDSEAKLSAIKPWLRYFINSDEVHNLLPNEADESMHVKPPEQCLTQQRPSGHAVATAGRCKVSTIWPAGPVASTPALQSLLLLDTAPHTYF